ncbi:sugar ABC transporter permease [Micromonospora yasonensis]|uniref:carbohydrate ABC transporter permease n=1 Tax=Micromonospora yasonensis TaxID=1128667 RepID=UPI0022309692|nr:sugar ABC transporter permease [Micromonospora yasonensis]MCW3844129.1 sugar ABC transporter permease [Micromonospora yasonensis]
MDLTSAVPFLLGKAVLFGAFMLFPFVYTVYLTFQRGSLLSGLRFAGLDNYRAVAGDPLFRQALWNTFLFMVVLIPLTLVVTIALGLLLSSSVRGMSVYRSLIYMPSLLSIVVAGLIWKMLIDGETGPLERFASGVLHLRVPWLNDGNTAIVFLSIVTLWTSAGFYSLIFMSAFNNVSDDLLDAARVDGASGWQILTRVKLPLIKPVMQVVLVLVTINAVQVFDLVYVITQGGPGTATYTAMWYIYQNAFNGGSVPYAATMSMVLLLVTAIIAAFFIGRGRGEGADDGRA